MLLLKFSTFQVDLSLMTYERLCLTSGTTISGIAPCLKSRLYVRGCMFAAVCVGYMGSIRHLGGESKSFIKSRALANKCLHRVLDSGTLEANGDLQVQGRELPTEG